jgi:hypothetical protein
MKIRREANMTEIKINKNEAYPDDNLYRLQTPDLPLLGPHDFRRLLQSIYKSILEEATSAEFYGRLFKNFTSILQE